MATNDGGVVGLVTDRHMYNFTANDKRRKVKNGRRIRKDDEAGRMPAKENRKKYHP